MFVLCEERFLMGFRNGCFVASAEFETVEDDGFIFKVRKKRLEEIQAAAAEEEGAPHAEPPHLQPVAEQSFEVEKRKKRLLTLKAM